MSALKDLLTVLLVLGILVLAFGGIILSVSEDNSWYLLGLLPFGIAVVVLIFFTGKIAKGVNSKKLLKAKKEE